MKFASNIINRQARAPGLSETGQWHERPQLPHAINPTAPLVKLSELSMMAARHLSSDSKLTVDCGLAMLRRHNVSVVLYTSRHGELGRNYRILHVLTIEQALSPTDLALPVHNSAMGNLTIAARKSIVPSSLSAGRDTFQQGLREVIGLL